MAQENDSLATRQGHVWTESGTAFDAILGGCHGAGLIPVKKHPQQKFILFTQRLGYCPTESSLEHWYNLRALRMAFMYVLRLSIV